MEDENKSFREKNVQGWNSRWWTGIMPAILGLYCLVAFIFNALAMEIPEQAFTL